MGGRFFCVVCFESLSLLMLWGGKKKKGPAARKDADVGCYVPLVNVVEREAARIDLPLSTSLWHHLLLIYFFLFSFLLFSVPSLFNHLFAI